MTIHNQEVNFDFPEAPKSRPYTFINMVSTIDGKTVTGTRRESVPDLGSDHDHEVMRQLELAADGVLIGAGNLRATKGLWYPAELFRIVATRSGDLDYGSRFFVDAMDKAMVIAPDNVHVPQEIMRLPNDFPSALKRLKSDFGIERLLIEGGSDLNADLLRLDLVDELFLTLAPKVKLGRDLPTYAGGEPLPGRDVQHYGLVEHHVVGDEVFLRYRRRGSR